MSIHPDPGLPHWLVPPAAVPDHLRPLVAGTSAARGAWARLLGRGVDPGAGPGVRESAVLLLLADEPAGPDLLLTQRAGTLRHHAGQPAFPGGALDPGETAIEAALREAREETGLDPAGVTPLLLLPRLHLPVSAYAVTPVVGHWARPSAVAPVDPAETAAVARVPLAQLADPANRLRVRHSSGYTGPAFDVAGMRVWGFTAALVDVLLDLGGWSVPWDRSRVVDLVELPGSTS